MYTSREILAGSRDMNLRLHHMISILHHVTQTLCRYLMPEEKEVTQVLIAWANLYISIRMAAPSLVDISKAYVE